MTQASLTGWQRGRTITLILGGLLLSALIVGSTTTGSAQPTRPAPKGKTPPKGKGPVIVKPTPPPPLKLTVVSKDQSVFDTVKTINASLDKAWKDNNIVQSRWADDYEFIRRASLDVIGRIATPGEIAEFLRDPTDTRRSLLIDRLLNKPEYANHWAEVWTNWLLTRTGLFGRGRYHDEMARWLKDQFALNLSYDQLVRGLLTASGKNDENGAVNFILAHVGENVPAGNRNEDGQFEMVPITSRISRLFLGIQVQCAQCHDHPFTNSIKQNHFWGINAFLRQVERNGNLPRRRQDGLMTLELRDNTNVNTKAKVYYEKRNGVLLEANAEFLPVGDAKKGQRLPPAPMANSAARNWPTSWSITTTSARLPSIACGQYSWAGGSFIPWTISTTRTRQPTPNCSTSCPPASATTTSISRS